MMSKKGKFFTQAGVCFIMIWCIFGFQWTAFAADRMKVVEKYTGESEVTLYVNGSKKELENVTVQIGSEVCGSVAKSTLAEAKQPVRTLVMLDNSQSIPKKDRTLISNILIQLISDRAAQEEIAIAVLNKNIEYLTDYTSLETSLTAALDQITYRNTKTYLTGVLYDWISQEYVPQSEDIFYRLIVIADGTDNKPIGYTQDEFYSLLREYPVPIYTIGMKTKDNNENLKNLFAISRAANAGSFLLDDMEQVSDINAQLNTDQNILKIVISPKADQLDGNKKAIKFVSSSGDILSTEAVMPQIVNEKSKTDDPKTNNTKTDNTIKIETETDDLENIDSKIKEAQTDKKQFLIVALVAAGCIAVILAVILIVKIKKKHMARGSGSGEIQNRDFQADPDDNGPLEKDTDQTEMVSSSDSQNEDQTVVFWDSQEAYHVVLSDIRLAAKSFEFPLKSAVVIGRKQDGCDIVLDYDRTVSGRHCRLAVRDGRFYITDLKSSNGTFINDRRVLAEMEIISGNILKLGKLELKFEVS